MGDNNRELVDTIHRIRTWLEIFGKNAPAVVVPVYNAFNDVHECIDSLLTTTPTDSPILMIDDCSTDSRIQQLGETLSSDHPLRLLYIRKDRNSGFVGSVNLGFAAAHPRDVVVVNSDVVLPARWLERLQSAAYVRTNVATVTPFTNHGTMVSVPHRNRPANNLPTGLTLSEVDTRIERASLHLYPPIPTAIGHCTYFRRSVLDAVGYFDEAFAPGYGEEVDISQRAIAHGFIHLVADDLFVYHKGSRSFDAAGRLKREQIQISHEQLIHKRYPWYTSWMRAESHASYSPLAYAIGRARRSLLPTRIAVDATYIASTTTGTSVVAFELIRALSSAPHRIGEVFVIVRNGTSSAFRERLGAFVDGIYSLDQLDQMDAPMFDLVFRPAQVQTHEELMRLQSLAEKFVVFQLDFIAYANPAYASSYDAWMEHRRLTKLTLSIADGVGYLSDDVVADGAGQGLAVPEDRSCVFNSGVDHFFHLSQEKSQSPSGRLTPNSFLLVLGTNFMHKNRVHALLIFEQLLKQTGWPGDLVFAGPQVSHGGSTPEENILMKRMSSIVDRIVELGEVREYEKIWLLQHAAIVLYPSVCEGFGLIPFEAAAYSTPTIPARSTSLQEILGEDIVYFETFDPVANAHLVERMLTDAELAQRQVQAILLRAAQYRWSSVAETVWEFVHRTLAAPPRSHLIRQELMSGHLSLDISPIASPELLPFWSRWAKRFRKVLAAIQGRHYRNILLEIKQYLRWRLGP